VNGVSSSSRLLTQPSDIFGLILEHGPDESLASLALVNSNCLQVAHSCQFRSVLLDFSPAGFSILRTLQSEAIKRSQYSGRPPKATLGPVSDAPPWPQTRIGALKRSEPNSIASKMPAQNLQSQKPTQAIVATFTISEWPSRKRYHASRFWTRRTELHFQNLWSPHSSILVCSISIC
jgi:hypothetical protein